MKTCYPTLIEKRVNLDPLINWILEHLSDKSCITCAEIMKRCSMRTFYRKVAAVRNILHIPLRYSIKDECYYI